MRYLISGFVFLLLFILAVFAYGEVDTQVGPYHQIEKERSPGYTGLISPENYGTLILDRYADRMAKVGMNPVVFPHWLHRVEFTCKVCHVDVGFTMKLGADDIKMLDIMHGRWCGKCHNGKVAFAPVQCSRCHSLGKTIKENRRMEEVLKDLPANLYGNKVDWIKLIEGGKILPRASIDGNEDMIIFDKDIEINVKGPRPRPHNVVFPHKQHTEWLHCTNCHTGIFKAEAGGNPEMRMEDILKGQWCGVCHGKVAFPFEDCFRCHPIREPPPYGSPTLE